MDLKRILTNVLCQRLYRPLAYAGIGSSTIPPLELRLIADLGEVLARCGSTLRGGGAPGADLAFEVGCDRAEGRKQIFLPWEGFNNSLSCFRPPSKSAEFLASFVHSKWSSCTEEAKMLHARSCNQILGEDLNNPVDLVLFWAPEKRGAIAGETAFTVNLARRMEIPTVNLWHRERRAPWEVLVKAWEQYSLWYQAR